jgi:hypothetical protein
MSRIGCSPRFNSPLHPASSGLTERFNKTYKEMLSKFIHDNPRQWHKLVPYLVWALREVPNSTTGFPPFTLVYGRSPRGPLSILKENWEGNRELPPSLGKSAVQYLQELKNNLKIALDSAEVYSKEAQTKYAHYYNKRAKDKHFMVNEKVVVLVPDSTNKLLCRWRGPCTVKRVRSPYSYEVDMGDGSVRHLHADKIRKFVERVATVAFSMVNEGDEDFGQLQFAPTDRAERQRLPSELIEPERLAHLSDKQQRELLAILDRYADCFSNQPGLCPVVEHEIELVPGFVPKRSKAYRIPEVLKAEVDRQTDELVRTGLIVPSKSSMSSPIVCVPKKNGEVRIACDYRYLNSYTRNDAFPMPNLDEVKMTVGRAQYISVYDAKSGYHQLTVREKDQWLTAFVTHSGLWEWRRMPFGLKCSGATFVRAVQQILYPIREFSASYIDDLAVYSEDWGLHLAHPTVF